MADFGNSFSTQASNNCSIYSVTDTSNYGNNDQNVTENNFSSKSIYIRDAINNQLINQQTVSINQATVVFNINSFWTAQLQVSQYLNIKGGGSNGNVTTKTLPCLIDM